MEVSVLAVVNGGLVPWGERWHKIPGQIRVRETAQPRAVAGRKSILRLISQELVLRLEFVVPQRETQTCFIGPWSESQRSHDPILPHSVLVGETPDVMRVRAVHQSIWVIQPSSDAIASMRGVEQMGAPETAD